MNTTNAAPLILNPHGKSARENSDACPKCGKGKEFRKPAANFGEPFDHCVNCGHEFREGR